VSHSGNQLIKAPFMEPEVQVCHSQEATTGLHQEPDEFHLHSHILLLGAYAQLRRATFSFVMSVRPPVRMELGSHWTDFIF
jgi:predicted neutral ceramidase superfamily lipid hydrolase